MSNTRARHRNKAPWPKLCVHYVNNCPCSALPCLQREIYTLHFVHNHAFSAPIYMLHCNALEIALCTQHTSFALLVFHTLHCPLCTAPIALALNIKHTTALSALLALLVAVSLIFTPTRLLRRPRATKIPESKKNGWFFKAFSNRASRI